MGRGLIHGNFFHQNPTEALFQAEGNVIFYSNLLLNDFPLDDAANEPNQRRSRSDCMWKNWEYMASYGR